MNQINVVSKQEWLAARAALLVKEKELTRQRDELVAARNTSFAAVSRAPIAKIEAFRKRMGWSFPWFSSHGTDFNYDFHVTLARAARSTEYNFADAEALHQSGKLWATEGERRGSACSCERGMRSSTHTRPTPEAWTCCSAARRRLPLVKVTKEYPLA